MIPTGSSTPSIALIADHLPITREEVVLAHGLLAAHPRLLPRDAIHAAVVLANRLECIVTADKVFDAIRNLNRLDPPALYPEE